MLQGTGKEVISWKIFQRSRETVQTSEQIHSQVNAAEAPKETQEE